MAQMKSLNKALDILEIFIDSKADEIRLSEISELSGLNRSNVNRIVSVLTERGYLRQPEKWGKYSLGSKFFSYYEKIKNRLKLTEIAMPYLVSLNKNINETVLLVEWDGKAAFYRAMLDTTHPLRIIPEMGREVSLYCTSIGKIILANKTKQELSDYFKMVKLTALTENTITDANILQQQLHKIAIENIAYDDEEHFAEARSVASGVKNSEGKIIACVGIFSPSARLSWARILDIAPEVKQCAVEISKALGHSENIACSYATRPKQKPQKVKRVTKSG